MDGTPKESHDHEHDHEHKHYYMGASGHGAGCQCPQCMSGGHGKGCRCPMCYGGKYDSMEGLEGMLAGMMSKQGVDPGLLALMKDRDHGDGGHNNWWWIILLFLFIGRGRGGLFGEEEGHHGGGREHGESIKDFVTHEENFNKITDAIAGNRMAIEHLSQDLGIEVREIERAIGGVKELIKESNGDVKLAVEKCCCDTNRHMDRVEFEMQKSMDKCCCDTNRHIDQVDCDIKTKALQTDYLIEKKFCETNAHIEKCCCDNQMLIDRKFCDQNLFLERQFCDIKSREDFREIERLKAELAQRSAKDHDDFIIRAIREERRCDQRREAWERCHCQCAPISDTNPANSPAGCQ